MGLDFIMKVAMSR